MVEALHCKYILIKICSKDTALIDNTGPTFIDMEFGVALTHPIEGLFRSRALAQLHNAVLTKVSSTPGRSPCT